MVVEIAELALDRIWQARRPAGTVGKNRLSVRRRSL
jgi:hypothetical protein